MQVHYWHQPPSSPYFDTGTTHQRSRGQELHHCQNQYSSLHHLPPFLPLSLSPSFSDLYWEQHFSLIHMTTSYQEETDRLLPEYSLPQEIEKLIEAGKYSNVEDRVTKVCVCVCVCVQDEECVENNNSHEPLSLILPSPFFLSGQLQPKDAQSALARGVSAMGVWFTWRPIIDHLL